jgi:hypothetical protein
MADRVAEIKEKWKNELRSVCAFCMENCVNHWRRKYDCPQDKPRDDHAEDGELYASAGSDIKTLLEYIDFLEDELTNNKK